MTDIGVNSLTIPLMPSLVHMLDYQRIGEVAGRSLFPCLLQVDAVASGLAVFSPRPTEDALRLRSRSGVSSSMSIRPIDDHMAQEIREDLVSRRRLCGSG